MLSSDKEETVCGICGAPLAAHLSCQVCTKNHFHVAKSPVSEFFDLSPTDEEDERDD